MKFTIRLPCEQEITVEIDDCHTIVTLKEMICLQDSHFQMNQFTLYDQTQPLDHSIPLSTLSPLLYLIPDTSDKQKSTPTICIYPSATTSPIVPSVPKASFRKKPSQQYADEDDDDCTIL
jgi:hypothetical protein